jgi:hypothetical protein
MDEQSDLNDTATAILLSGGGMMSASQAANFAREVETNVAHHALQTRDLGILETISSEMDDLVAARELLQRIDRPPLNGPDGMLVH